MTEKELKRELEIYQGMYYTLLNAVMDIIEVTSNSYVKAYLQKAVFRSKDILYSDARPSLSRRECADLLRRFVDESIKNNINIEPEFVTLCVDKILELNSIESLITENVNEGLENFRQKIKEADNNL